MKCIQLHVRPHAHTNCIQKHIMHTHRECKHFESNMCVLGVGLGSLMYINMYMQTLYYTYTYIICYASMHINFMWSDPFSYYHHLSHSLFLSFLLCILGELYYKCTYAYIHAYIRVHKRKHNMYSTCIETKVVCIYEYGLACACALYEPF